MTTNKTNGARKFFTRFLAAGALLAVYCVGTVAMTGAFMASTVTSAQAQRGGRGRGGGRGFRGGRGYRGGFGFRGGRRWVCRHNGYTSGRRCFWVG